MKPTEDGSFLSNIQRKIMTTPLNFVYAIGFFSEIILLILVSFLVHGDLVDWVFFLVFFSCNGILNYLLKPLFRDHRPRDPIKFLDSERFAKDKQNVNHYGMPSGHGQNVGYAIVYLYLTIRTWTEVWVPWMSVCGVIAALTVYERWAFKNHTIAQLVVGLIVGGVFGYGVVALREYSKKYIHHVQRLNYPPP